MHEGLFETRYSTTQNWCLINFDYIVIYSCSTHIYMYMCLCTLIVFCWDSSRRGQWFNSTQVGSASFVPSGRHPVEFYLDRMNLCCWHRHQRIKGWWREEQWLRWTPVGGWLVRVCKGFLKTAQAMCSNDVLILSPVGRLERPRCHVTAKHG